MLRIVIGYLLRLRISYILKSIDHAIFVQNAASLDSCKNFGNRSTVSLLCQDER